MTLVATSYGLEQEDKLKLRAQHFQTALKHLQIGAGMCQTSLCAPLGNKESAMHDKLL